MVLRSRRSSQPSSSLALTSGTWFWSSALGFLSLFCLLRITFYDNVGLSMLFDTSPIAATTSWYPSLSVLNKCQSPVLLPNGGPINIVWSWHDPPTTESLQKTLTSIAQQALLRHIKIEIYCGSNVCVERAQQAAAKVISSNTLCVQIHTMVVPSLAQQTPLEDWAGDHLLAKLLYAQNFEETLQVAMQLVIMVKSGGLTMLPGSTITDAFLPFLYSPREVIFSYHGAKVVMPKVGLHAAVAPSKHSAMIAIMEAFLKESHWPEYHPHLWPVKVPWQNAIETVLSTYPTAKMVNTSQMGIDPPLYTDDSDQKPRHFGTLTYQARRSFLVSKSNYAMNRGDEMQGLGGLQFVPRLDAFVERDRLDIVTVIDDYNSSSLASAPVSFNTLSRPAVTPTTVFLNAWYGTPQMVWPPPGQLEPIFVAMHLNNHLVKDKVKKSKEYLSQNWPIGARDTSTDAFFKSIGVHSLFSACMTMTIRSSTSRPRNETTADDVLIVDVSEKGLGVLPDHVTERATFLTAKIKDPNMVQDQLGRYILAHHMKMSLQKAKLVVTQRLHIALPAASMGTPVILILDDALPGGGGINGNSRFSGLQAAVHTINISSKTDASKARAILREFDWDEPPLNPNPELIEVRRNALQVLAMCHEEELFDSGKKFGILPATWEYPRENEVCQRQSSVHQDESAIHIASALTADWLDGEPVFSSWIKALYNSNHGKKFCFYFLTDKMNDKQRCLVRWIVKQYFPSSEVYTLSVDRFLDGIPYSGIKHVPIVTQSRLLLDRILPCVDFLLWIDTDAMVMNKLTPLWEKRLDLPPCGIAGRNSEKDNVMPKMVASLLTDQGRGIWEKASHNKRGFNAGVLVLSLERLRQTSFLDNVAMYWSFTLGGNDQIALNMQCNGTHMSLDGNWNVYKDYPHDPVYEKPEYWRIVHMQGMNKPWVQSTGSLHDEVWENIKLPLVESLLGPRSQPSSDVIVTR